MARLYADEDFPFPVVERLRQLGHDVLTTLEAGRANQGISDADQLVLSVAIVDLTLRVRIPTRTVNHENNPEFFEPVRPAAGFHSERSAQGQGKGPGGK